MVFWALLSIDDDDETTNILNKIVQIKRQELKVSTLLGYSGVRMNEKEPPRDSTSESFEGG